MATPEEIARNIRALKESQVAFQYESSPNSLLDSIGRSAPIRYSLSTLGHVFDALDTGLNLVTVGARPLVTELNPALEAVYKKYEKDTGLFGISNITPSALIEEGLPGKRWYKGPIKFAADVAGDPLTYVSFGMKTVAGETLAKARSLAKAKQVITLDSKVAQNLARIYGEAKPTTELIRKAKATKAIPTMAGEAAAGERALVQIGHPLGASFGPQLTLVKGVKAFEKLDDVRQMVRVSKYGSAARKLFSTATNSPEFDAIEQDFVNLLQYRKGEVIASAQAINDQLDALAIRLEPYGWTRERIDRAVTDLVERPTLTRRIAKKVVTRVFPKEVGAQEKVAQVLTSIGQGDEAKKLLALSPTDPVVKQLTKDLDVPDTAIAKFMSLNKTYEQLGKDLQPLKKVIDYVNDTNSVTLGPSSWAKMLDKVIQQETDIPPFLMSSLSGDYEVNPHSKLLREAMKSLYSIAPELNPIGNSSVDNYIATHIIDNVAEKFKLGQLKQSEVIDDLFRKLPKKPPTTKVVQGLPPIDDHKAWEKVLNKEMASEVGMIKITPQGHVYNELPYINNKTGDIEGVVKIPSPWDDDNDSVGEYVLQKQLKWLNLHKPKNIDPEDYVDTALNWLPGEMGEGLDFWKGLDTSKFITLKEVQKSLPFMTNVAGVPEHRIDKLAKKLQAKYPGIPLNADKLVSYYQTHYYTPKIMRATTGDTGIKSVAEQAIDAGKLADFLKQDPGDVLDRLALLINNQYIDNRGILPSFVDGVTGLNRVQYDGNRVVVNPGNLQAFRYLTRGEFETQIKEAFDLIKETNQFLPVLHGTMSKKDILKTGAIKAAASNFTGTIPRDYAAKVFPKIFASLPSSAYGTTKFVIPINFLDQPGSSMLLFDGIRLPANPQITKYLLTKGKDGIAQASLRYLAITDYTSFQTLVAVLRKGGAGVDPEKFKTRFAKALADIDFHPDIHLSGPIPLEKVYELKTAMPGKPQVGRIFKQIQDQGIPLDHVQLLQRGREINLRLFGKAEDSKVPLIDIMIPLSPELNRLLKTNPNALGISVPVEKQSAAIEKYLGKLKVPEGESLYTYLRKANPQLFETSLQVLHDPEWIKNMEDLGFLGDKAFDALALNVLRNSKTFVGKGLTAKEVLQSGTWDNISRDILLHGSGIEKHLVEKIKVLYPGLSQSEFNKVIRYAFRQIKNHERGHNVFHLGLPTIPRELMVEWINEVQRMTKIPLPPGLPKSTTVAKVLTTYMDKGEQAAIRLLNGGKNPGSPKDFQILQSALLDLASHADELFAEAHSMYQLNYKGLQGRWPQAHTLMDKIYKRKGWKTEWIYENTQIPRKLAKQQPEMFDIAQAVHRMQHEWLEIEDDAGVDAYKLAADIRYTRHTIAKEAKEYLLKNFFKARVWTDEHNAQILRSFRNLVAQRIDEADWLKPEYKKLLKKKDGEEFLHKLVKEGEVSRERANSLFHYLTVEEVNALARTGKLKLLNGQKVEKFFEENPAIQLKVRGIEGARARTGAEFFRAIKPYGVQAAQAQEGYRAVKPEALQGFFFPNEIADHIDRFYENTRYIPGTHPFLDLFDNLQGLWKAYTLSIFPAYHTRNMVGNVWNNFLAGVVNPNHYIQAEQVLLGKPTKISTGFGQTYNTADIIDLAKRHGIWNVGQYTGDINDLFEKELKQASLLAKARDTKLLKAGRSIGIHIEQNAYLAHFINRLEQGYSPAAAAQSVKKYLFDYADLTEFEKKVMRRVFPFYTWTRKNIPLQLEAMITQPGKPLGIYKAKMAFESTDDGVPDERYLPDWMVQNFPIRVRRHDQTGNYEYFLLGSWLPLADIDKLFRPDRLVGNMLTPFLKEPMQQLFNKDLFTGQTIDTGGEYDRVAGVNMPKRLAHLVKNVRAISEADKLGLKLDPRAPANNDLSLQAKLVGLFTGKMYPLDVKKEKKVRKFKQEEQDRNTSRLINKAKKNHDEEEVKRLLELVRKRNAERAKFNRGGD